MHTTQKLLDAERIALELLGGHGLAAWSFGFNRARRRAGACFFPDRLHTGRIELSAYFCECNREEVIREAVLHEIAHALAFIESGDRGHGPAWKQVCERIGARPERCYDTNEVVMPRGPWRATCGGCQKEFHRHRRPRSLSGYWCLACGKERGGLLWGYHRKAQ